MTVALTVIGWIGWITLATLTIAAVAAVAWLATHPLPRRPDPTPDDEQEQA